MPGDPGHTPERKLGSDPKEGRGGTSRPRGKSHPGMGRGFRELPEAMQWGARLLGEDWEKDQRVHQHGVAGPIVVTPPKEDVAFWFISSAVANGFELRQAELLWKEVFSFASFGFCKSHAAAFALPTYLSAWLKAHYPAAFLAGVLTHDPGMYPRRLIVADARNFGIPILPIDVNHSDRVYRVEPAGEPPRAGIRLAFSEVRGMSEAELDSLLRAREERGSFSSLEDMWRRTDLSQPVLENLIHIGALDPIEPRTRHELMWRAMDLFSQPKPRGGTQMGFALEESISEALPGLPRYTPLEETEAELEVSGIDARRHIMSLYQPLMAELGCTPGNKLASLRNDSEVWVAGVKVASQTPAIRSGQRIIFVTIDDVTGPIDVTAFERVQPRCARTIFHSWLLLVRGVVRKRGGASRRYRTDPHNVGITVVVDEVFDLAELAKDRKSGHSIAAALGRQRKKQSFRGLDAKGSNAAPSRLWHASGGSAGR